MEKLIPGKLYKYYYIGRLSTKHKNNVCMFLKREGLFDTVLFGNNRLGKISHLECLIEEVV